jgi:hypothetical protein
MTRAPVWIMDLPGQLPPRCSAPERIVKPGPSYFIHVSFVIAAKVERRHLLAILNHSIPLISSFVIYSPGGETGGGPRFPGLPVSAAMICLPWNRPFSMKISPVYFPPRITPAT